MFLALHYLSHLPVLVVKQHTNCGQPTSDWRLKEGQCWTVSPLPAVFDAVCRWMALQLNWMIRTQLVSSGEMILLLFEGPGLLCWAHSRWIQFFILKIFIFIDNLKIWVNINQRSSYENSFSLNYVMFPSSLPFSFSYFLLPYTLGASGDIIQTHWSIFNWVGGLPKSMGCIYIACNLTTHFVKEL